MSPSGRGSHHIHVGRTLGHIAPWLVSVLKIFQFPAVSVDTVSGIISHYLHHLKVIPQHSQELGTVLLYRTVNGPLFNTHTQACTHLTPENNICHDRSRHFRKYKCRWIVNKVQTCRSVMRGLRGNSRNALTWLHTDVSLLKKEQRQEFKESKAG